MFAVEMLPAGEGDALVVEYGPGHRLLVDAGPWSAWPALRQRLLARNDDHYDLFVITHIDEDHIGGAIALLDDPDLRHRVPEVWFNGYVHCAPVDNVLGPVNGEQLTQRIVRGGFGWNTRPPAPSGRRTAQLQPADRPIVVTGEAELPVVDLPSDGPSVARLVLLTPTRDALEALARVWLRVVTKAGIVAGSGHAGHQSGLSPRPRQVEPLPEELDARWLTENAAARKQDSSKANASSISFVLEIGPKRLLMTGDATPGDLISGLKRYGDLVGEKRPRFDLVKLPHHGSGGNVTPALVSAIDATRYLVSSDGMIHGHPDDSALARLILNSAAPPTIYCNYASCRTKPWLKKCGEAGLATFVLPKGGKSGLRVSV